MDNVNTAECKDCEFGEVVNQNGIAKIHCLKKEKYYIYGQIVPCDDKK